MIPLDGFEIRLRADGRDLFRREWDARQSPPIEAVALPIRAEETFAIHVRIPATNPPRALRLRLGEEVIAELPAGSRYAETPDLAWLRNEYGESRVVLEHDEGGAEVSDEPLFALEIAVVAREEVARDFRAMVRDVAAIHEGLAQDVTGRSFSRRRLDGGSVSLLHPRAMLNRLREVHRHLEASIALIAKQPSVTLARSVRLARYRGGDRIDAAAAASAARDPGTRVGPSGQIVALGKLLVRGPALSEDLPEHRHIAEGLRRLSNRAEGLARHCERTAGRLEADARRWAPARPSAGGGAFPVANTLPVSGATRAGALRRLSTDARLVAEDFQATLRRHPFLAEAGQPRTDFGPTPAFLGRPAYREVYRALVRARQALGVVIDGDDVRIAHRSLPTLYEYWCFLRAVGHLHRRLGRPGSNLTFSLIDDIYRPDLTPGQHFRFEAAGAQVVATYEPEIRPWREALERGDRLGSSLTRESLRPDITIEVTRESRPPAILVLDAKSTDAFSPRKFREMADYSRQVFEPRTGRQPVRQVFLLHRDRLAHPWENLPGYLADDRPVAPDAAILGAVPCVPDRMKEAPGLLARVIDRFLEVHASLPIS